jgi:hypothetical protein
VTTVLVTRQLSPVVMMNIERSISGVIYRTNW